MEKVIRIFFVVVLCLLSTNIMANYMEGYVDMGDYASFAADWQSPLQMEDLAVFTNHWMAFNTPWPSLAWWEMEEVDGTLTQAEVLIGTPFYMAPEIISQPGAASPQSDLYALGAVGYFLVTGRQVFEGGSAVEICAAHLHDTPERPSVRAGRDIPRDLEDLLLRCLAKDPDDRPGSPAELQDALARCADAGSWGPAEAIAWWGKYGAGVAGADSADAVPMSKTGLIVDLDSRMVSAERAAKR